MLNTAIIDHVFVLLLFVYSCDFGEDQLHFLVNLATVCRTRKRSQLAISFLDVFELLSNHDQHLAVARSTMAGD